MEIKDLQPREVFAIFDEITKIPRPSKKEEKIRQYLLDFAKAHNLEVKTDKVGNVVITKPATPGHENAPTVIMQGHMDMVCESNDKNFDFANSPIPVVIDGDWVRIENPWGHCYDKAKATACAQRAQLSVLTTVSVWPQLSPL